jgi:DNA-directed RNA polymerase subunit RPC12/RpoP
MGILIGILILVGLAVVAGQIIRFWVRESSASLAVYRCPECGRQIESLLSDAGSRDYCPACGKALRVPGEAESEPVLKGKAAEQDSKSRFTVERVFHEAVEAAVAKAALDEAGIPYLAEDFQRNPYDGVLATQFGWGRILVREQDVERAKEIIQEALKPLPLQDGEDGPEGDDEAEPEAE